MGRNFNGIFTRNNWRCTEVAKMSALLLLFLSVSQGLNSEEIQLSSSQYKSERENIRIHASESVKDTRTLDHNVINGKSSDSVQSVIFPTEMVTNSSYIEKKMSEEKERLEKLRKEIKQTTENDSKEKKILLGNYLNTIKPTKTVSVEKVKIAQTEIKKSGSGEAKGVSMVQSRPQKPLKEMNYSRKKRGFGNPTEDSTEEEKINSNNVEGKKKIEKNNFGKNYNQIEQTLGKIAKITINDENNQLVKSTVSPINFRESREEENRKASPDIQDIITGIVNILNGKTTKQNEGNTGRPPRPTSTRINNRGPPRISDLPPLDFDGPPAYKPLPPPPPKRIPPPYPFDIPPPPPPVPNIPLPPQPYKPGLSKLPSHPFIDGVPIPEMIIPEEQMKKPIPTRSPDLINTGYDTISVSEPLNNEKLHPLVSKNVTKVPVPQTEFKYTTVRNEVTSPTLDTTFESTTKIKNSQIGNTTNTPLPKPNLNKDKVNGQKVSSNNKNSNKRVRPNPVIRPSEMPTLNNKTDTSSSVVKKEDNKTVDEIQINATKTTSNQNKTEISVTEQRPLKEEIINGTKKTGEVVESPFKVSTNVSTVLEIKPPIHEFELKENNTKNSSAILKTTTEISKSTTKKIESHKDNDKYEVDLDLPVLLEPSIGFGEATPVLESSILELSMLPTEEVRTTSNVKSTQWPGQPVTTETSHYYKVRPGIVLDDPEYKPGVHKRPIITPRPVITAPPPHSHYGEIFDVTVHAVQGPGGEMSSGKPFVVPVDIDGAQIHNPQVIKGDVSVITKPEDGQNFVSIDGKRTYINLFGEVSSTKINPTSTQSHITGTGYATPQKDISIHQPSNNKPPVSPTPPRKVYKRPSHPPVRIDTCIVGDEATCDFAQNEMCRTEDGVSSCHCRPGYNRRKHRDTCRRVVSMLTSLRVDRLYDRKVKWQETLRNPESDDYLQLSYEASQAIESAMSMTPFSDDFINSRINSIYVAKNLENNEPAVYVNVTIQLEENLDTVRPAVKHDIQRHLLRVIQRRNNNVGTSAVWVDAPPGSILALQDVDECSSSELHDCHERAICLNTFGSFKCQCPSGFRDPWVGNIHREGRFCETCPSDYCNNRGECKFEHGMQVCQCSGSFYGAQCEIDGEVLGVAIGASVAAAIIIVLTLICLCMWSRRWSREQKSAVGAGMGSPVFGYMATGPTVKTPSVGGPPYQVSIEDRIRWAQIADVMAKSNHYAQPEPVNTNKRTSFGGYPTLPSHTMSMPGTLPLPTIAPPVPLPRLTLPNKQPMGTYGAHSQLGSLHQSNHGIRSSLENSSSSEEEDRADLLGRNFIAPRPKSRTSVANQSGIYYDVDFDRSDAYSKQNTIPMNTYTLNPQHQVRPYFRCEQIIVEYFAS